MLNPLDLTGKKIFVAGASSGIGRAVAVYLSKLGANIAIAARREDKLQETLSVMEGENHRYYVCDFNNTDTIEPVVAAAVKDIGPFSGLVYSAGLSQMRPLAMLRTSDINAVMTVNLYAFVEFAKCITKKKNVTTPASIVAVSSVASLLGDKAKLSYCSSKAALEASTRCMAKELGHRGIRVNTIRPTWVNTGMMDVFFKEWKDSADAESHLAQHYAGVVQPDELAAMCAFLLSDNSKTITGTAISIDSGRLA
ncbi:SDR family NAD(P)-dependent oxidoreductase [Synergistes jonesii]|uniref:Short-chain dehydrogenase n=1 Tax=Synergistes jonesii TaxID=2754 RepID=A0A073IQW4_9BACT|nr:SDR family oxidoreductase [Synergistes jonesii]KEJ92149.1 hypothetical protein EH55_05280 [Synergistes jonesii]OFB62589.1 hypothetical protein JS73_07415 [Synergistes jonesii]OFB63251.1 hypothetical protein JS79_07940 [Synergistes jonesii]OFB64825.1 hypothetical protein JS72_03420 [Synergistes jonesii]OFB67587.1 hypothetical protein JS78_07420 [Synergistes jonesii]